MPTDLVYYVVFGEQLYYDNTVLSIRSLRTLGGFEGRVLVFSDKPLAKSLDIENVVLSFDSFKDWFELRFSAFEYFDFEGYRTVTFLDGDVLVTKPFLDLYDPDYALTTFRQIDTYWNTGIVNALYFDARMWYRHWYKHPVNAGQIIFRGPDCVTTLRTWRRVHEENRAKKVLQADFRYKKTWSDQCSLNYAIRSDQLHAKILTRGLRIPINVCNHFFNRDYALMHYAALPANVAGERMQRRYDYLHARAK